MNFKTFLYLLTVYAIDVVENLTQDVIQMKHDAHPLENCLFDAIFQEDDDLLDRFLWKSRNVPPRGCTSRHLSPLH